jgi:hypothetical protein
VRRLDHINYLGVEVLPNRDYLRDTLGALVTEQIVLDDGTTAGNAGARLVLAPDWQPVDWTEAERQRPGVGTADHPLVPHPRHAAGPGGGPRVRGDRPR